MMTASAVFFACKRAQHVALEKQRMVIEGLKEFGPQASWNSDGVWALGFQAGPQKLADEHLIRLKDLPVLWAIDLRETSITDRGLRHVASLGSLRWVMLPRAGVTERGVGELQKQRPDIRIVRFPASSSN